MAKRVILVSKEVEQGRVQRERRVPLDLLVSVVRLASKDQEVARDLVAPMVSEDSPEMTAFLVRRARGALLGLQERMGQQAPKATQENMVSMARMEPEESVEPRVQLASTVGLGPKVPRVRRGLACLGLQAPQAPVDCLA
jgi:hypothetical protein